MRKEKEKKRISKSMPNSSPLSVLTHPVYTVFVHPKYSSKRHCTGAFELLPLGMLSECSSSRRRRRRRSSSSKLGVCWLFISWPWISDLLL